HPARLVGRYFSRPRDPDHGARHQPDRRRPARRARSEAQAELRMALLEIRNLSVSFATAAGPFRAVDAIDLDVDAGDVVAIVGESGSGKSVAMLAVMSLLPKTA